MAVIVLSDSPPTVLNPKNSPPHKCNDDDLVDNGMGAYTCPICGRIKLGY